MTIIVDTREQLPLFEGLNCRRVGLDVGDYTTSKLFDSFVIERKSLQDLYGTMTKGNVRFHHCIFRARAEGIKMVMVVEGTKKNFKAKKFPQGNKRLMPGDTLIKIVDTFERKYLPIYWCPNRRVARIKILQLLREEELKLKVPRKGRRQL